MIKKSACLHKGSLVVALLVILVLAACSAPAPAPSQPTSAPAQPAATSAPVQPAATSVPEQPTATKVVGQPAATTAPGQPAATPVPPTVTPTATPTTKPGGVVRPTATSAGPLEFTVEFSPSAQRKGDRKVQLTVILHIKGGVAPFQVQEDGIAQVVAKTVDGVKYTRDWHDVGVDEPHNITVISKDGQQSVMNLMLPYSAW